jgi:hypothetical protein
MKSHGKTQIKNKKIDWDLILMNNKIYLIFKF